MRALLTCLLIVQASLAVGDQTVRSLSWRDLQQTAGLESGALDGDSLSVENDAPTARTFPLLNLPSPGITSKTYALKGEVMYEGVEGDAYLEMWSHLPGGKSYFTRTLSDSGPMGKISGSSKPRPFILPFYLRDQSGWLDVQPERLELKLVLPGKGKVQLSPISLVQDLEGAGSGQAGGAWWGLRVGTFVGGCLGAVIGVLAGLFGWLGGKAKAQGAVVVFFAVLLGLGILGTLAGCVALMLRQPYHVYYPLLLLGVISAVVGGIRFRATRKLLQESELRRMSAMDA